MNALIAVDWGTTSLRGALLDEHGQVVAEVATGQGILSVPPGSFATVFEANFQAWTSASGQFDAESPPLTLISGMAGSQQGWKEAPYCACPAGFGELGAHLQWVTPGHIAIVPGLRCEANGMPDVMRGEETQVFGALQLLGLTDTTVVLPGTHSKWVTVRGQRIAHFRTYMTGEVFGLLRQHSLLARTLPPLSDAAPDWDAEAFDEGVGYALRSQSLLHTAFSTRTLALFQRKSAAALASYLSGLVIGEELRAEQAELSKAGNKTGSDVVLVGAPALTQRYAQALALCQVRSQQIGAEATWHGLWALSKTMQTS